MSSTDRILAEVKVSSSAPGGPPRHSSLPLSSSSRKALSPAPSHTCTRRVSVRAATGLVLQRRRLWQPSTTRSGLQALAVALFIWPSVPFPSILKQSRLGCALIVIIIIIILPSSRPLLGYLWRPRATPDLSVKIVMVNWHVLPDVPDKGHVTVQPHLRLLDLFTAMIVLATDIITIYMESALILQFYFKAVK